MEKDVVEIEVVDSDNFIPIATNNKAIPGIASFNSEDFAVDKDGHVSSKMKYGTPQYLGVITGTNTDNNIPTYIWELSENSIKPTKNCAIGDIVMLISPIGDLKPGSLFKIISTESQVKTDVVPIGQISYNIDSSLLVQEPGSDKGKILSQAAVDTYYPRLNENGKVPERFLPSYVDDVIEGYLYNDKFYLKYNENTKQYEDEVTGEKGKIYSDLSTNSTYRWSGSQYIVVGVDVVLIDRYLLGG